MSRAQLTSTVEQNTGGAVAPFVAGKNKIINGDFSINQRNFTSVTSGGFTFDRWLADISTGTVTASAQTFTAGAAPVAGYESINFFQMAVSGQTGTGYAGVYQKIEDVRTLAGQTVTVSFWAKSASGTPNILPQLIQQFGSGGSGSFINNGAAKAISNTWQRYFWTFSVASISGKTIGTGSSLTLEILFSDGGGDGSTLGLQSGTFSVWGVQVEAGSVATPFTTASNTFQGELALCQRYYTTPVYGNPTSNNFGFGAICIMTGSSSAISGLQFPVSMRATPTLTIYGNGTQGQVRQTSNGTIVNLGTPTVYVLNTNGWAAIVSGSGSLVANNQYDFTYVASAEL
jgi:hypothetical protein